MTDTFPTNPTRNDGGLAAKGTVSSVVIQLPTAVLALCLPRLAANPLEGPGSYQTDYQKVSSAEVGGILPSVSVLVRALKADVIQRPLLRVLAPDAGAYGAVANFVNGLISGCACSCLIFHDFALVTGVVCSDGNGRGPELRPASVADVLRFSRCLRRTVTPHLGYGGDGTEERGRGLVFESNLSTTRAKRTMGRPMFGFNCQAVSLGDSF